MCQFGPPETFTIANPAIKYRQTAIVQMRNKILGCDSTCAKKRWKYSQNRNFWIVFPLNGCY